MCLCCPARNGTCLQDSLQVVAAGVGDLPCVAQSEAKLDLPNHLSLTLFEAVEIGSVEGDNSRLV